MATRIDSSTALEEFYVHVQSVNLRPLWLQPGLGSEPDNVVQPMLWQWPTIRENMVRAGDLMPVGGDGADRRVLSLVNPSMPGGRGTTRTLQAAVQMIFPGEEAPSHRHTAAAVRFVIEGDGAYTIVDGEPLDMEPGDFLLTPNWTWHGHSKESAGPMFWLDVLDAPFVRGMNWVFYEEHPSGGLQAAEKPRNDSLKRLGIGGVRPMLASVPGPKYSPLFTYRWSDVRPALDRLPKSEMSPFDGYALRYVNPITGGPVMPTMDAALQLLRPGQSTQAHRHTSNVIYYVAEGSGHSTLNGQRFDWSRSDVFCVPGWTWHEHAADPGATAVLFSLTDTPVLEALDVYREEARS